MITAFTVRNFKAIGDEPVRIEFKPITLLFGANSTGKSSILDALNYAYEVFLNHNLNAENLGLGQFERFVYRNELDRSIILTFELDFNLDIFDKFYGYDYDPTFKHLEVNNNQTIIPDMFSLLHPENIISGISKAYVKVQIKWNPIKQKPYFYRYETGLENEEVTAISANPESEEIDICYINTSHSIFKDLWIRHGVTLDELIGKIVDPTLYTLRSIDQEKENIQKNEIETFKSRLEILSNLGRLPYNDFSLSASENNIKIGLKYLKDALPPSLKLLNNSSINFIDSLDLFFKKFKRDQFGQIKFSFGNREFVSYSAEFVDIEKLFSFLLVLPRREIERWLNICHIGPLREIPSINFIVDNSYDKSRYLRWKNGLAAWDILYRIGQRPDANEYLIKINDWLANDQRLNTGYEVCIERYREFFSDHLDKLITVLADEKSPVYIKKVINDILCLPEKFRIFLRDKSYNLNLLPHEVGTGISQVLPIVVAAVGTGASLVTIEQPELHIHPAIQVQLGDLFITQSSDSEFFLIETHSEHLFLRLLRRINETFEGKLPPDIEPCTADDLAIYYLEKGSQGLRVRRLEISEDGDSKGDWPEGFFEERRAELF